MTTRTAPQAAAPTAPAGVAGAAAKSAAKTKNKHKTVAKKRKVVIPATAHRPARRIVLPKKAVKIAAKHRRRAGRPARIGTSSRAARYQMPKHDVKYLLRVSWKAFGYRGKALRKRVARNYKQVVRESERRPAVLQGFIGDVNDHHPAGGLLQFTKPTFKHWKVGGRNSRFNPLSNLLAGVNAQVHGPYAILSGRSGWSPPLVRNPLHRASASRVIS